MTAPLPVADGWTVNDVPMDCPAWARDPDKGGKGLTMTPGLRDTSVTVPRRRGVLPGDLVHDTGILVLNLWVLGVDPETGWVPAGSSSELMLARNLDVLLALFHVPTLRLRRQRSDGTGRCATGQLSQVLDPETVDSTPAYAELGVAIRIDDGYWYDAEPVTARAVVPVRGGTAQLWEFAGAQATMDGLVWTVLGPAWNPTVTDLGSRTWLAYDGVVPPGQALVYDGAGPEVYGAGGLIVDQGLVRRGRTLALSPGRPPTVQVDHTGPDPVTVQVTGRRAYLTA